MTIKKMKTMVRKSADVIMSALFPPRCLVCDEILEPEEQEYGIHPACESKLYPIYGAVCMHCGRPLGDRNPKCKKTEKETEEYFGSVREYCYDCIRKGYHKQSDIWQAKSLYLYKGAIKTAMYRFKYSNKREYATAFAKLAVQQYFSWIKHAGVEVIVPVPMYELKKRKRGYNQAESFAIELSKLTGLPMSTKLVKRVVDTTPQKGLNDKERRNNLKNAFQNCEFVVQYRCVLVVDDIYTTGSTAEAVAHELIKTGAHRVYLLTVCIGGDM